MDLLNETDHLVFHIESMSSIDKISQQDVKSPVQIKAEPVFIARQETHMAQIPAIQKDETKLQPQSQENIQGEIVEELHIIIENPENSEPGSNHQALPIENSPINNTQSLQNDTPSGEHSSDIPSRDVALRTWIYRVVSFYIAIALLSGYVVMMPLVDNATDGIFIIIGNYFGFLFFLSFFRRMPILNSCDAFCGVLYVWSLYFKKLGIISTCSFACAPFMLEVLAMLVYFKRMKLTYLKFLLRCYYAAQSLFLALKMDNTIEWDWLIVLGLSIACAGIHSSYSLFRIMLIPFKLRNSNSQIYSLPRRTIIIGALWYVGYYMSFLLSLLVLIAVLLALEPSGDNRLLTSVAYTGLGVCPLFVAWILIIKERLLRFTRAYQLDDDEEVELPIEETVNLEDGLKIVNFQVEKKESQTYFQSVNQNISSSDKERLNKRKQALYSVKQNSGPKKNFCQELVSKSMNEQECLTHFHPYTNLAYSENDIDETRRIKSLEESPPKPNEEDNLCYICCKSTSDAILVSCGHGGIYYGCATISIKKNRKCNECRRDVSEIYKIDPRVKFSNIVRGLEISKVVIIKEDKTLSVDQ